VYKRLFGVLWYGNRVGEKGDEQKSSSPTYVFPPEILGIVRQRFPDGDAGRRDGEFAASSQTYRVSWSDISGAKWPKPPKACEECSKSAKKPY